MDEINIWLNSDITFNELSLLMYMYKNGVMRKEEINDKDIIMTLISKDLIIYDCFDVKYMCSRKGLFLVSKFIDLFRPFKAFGD